MDQGTTKEENLMETLGKVDHSVCIWGVGGLVLYWERRDFWSPSALDLREKCSKNLVED